MKSSLVFRPQGWSHSGQYHANQDDPYHADH
jgi:hypothetical protein